MYSPSLQPCRRQGLHPTRPPSRTSPQFPPHGHPQATTWRTQRFPIWLARRVPEPVSMFSQLRPTCRKRRADSAEIRASSASTRTDGRGRVHKLSRRGGRVRGGSSSRGGAASSQSQEHHETSTSILAPSEIVLDNLGMHFTTESASPFILGDFSPPLPDTLNAG
jgi:hypothetical protein